MSFVPTPTPHSSAAAGFHIGYEVRHGPYGKGLYATHAIPAGALLWKNVSQSYAQVRDSPLGSVAAAQANGCNVLAFENEAEARARLGELLSHEARAYWMDHVRVVFREELACVSLDGFLGEGLACVL